MNDTDKQLTYSDLLNRLRAASAALTYAHLNMSARDCHNRCESIAAYIDSLLCQLEINGLNYTSNRKENTL